MSTGSTDEQQDELTPCRRVTVIANTELRDLCASRPQQLVHEGYNNAIL